MNKIYAKLLDVQNEGLTFAKTAENPFFRSKYLPLEELQKKLAPILEKYKLLVFHYSKEGGVVTAVVDVESGEKVESFFPLQQNLEPQKVGSAISYAKRYNLGQIFNIVTDVDDDANSTKEIKVSKPRTTESMNKTSQRIEAVDEQVVEIGLDEANDE